jgi:hypothetical protein
LEVTELLSNKKKLTGAEMVVATKTIKAIAAEVKNFILE